jgi:hypothetical protein
MAIYRDWYRLVGAHNGDCILNNIEIDVPQTTEQRLLLVEDWNKRKGKSNE